MRRVLNGKAMLVMCLLLWVLVARVLGGCSMNSEDSDKVRDLEFTVVGEADEPEELKKIIAEKKMESFKLTYSNDQGLYIAVGYGKQPTGGFSISVNKLYLTDNSIVFDSELLGPEKADTQGTESFPYIVVKTEYLENPVVFQ